MPAAVDLSALRADVAADHAAADPAHDVSHLDRVAAVAGWIAEQLGADPRPARVAGYVHDYHRVAEARTGVRPLPVHAANDLVRAVLKKHRIPRRWYPDVLCAVDATGRYRIAGHHLPADLAEVCPVAAAVHDADNLDALGVVGLARAVSYGTLLGEPLWDPEAAIRPTYVEGTSSSVLAHCYEKLVHLADEMLTEPGRQLARQRLNDLHGVLGRLRDELTAGPAGRPAPVSVWDPRTGYLRLTLAGTAPAAVDCRLSCHAQARIGLRGGADGAAVCYLELTGLPAVARAALTPATAVSTRGRRLRVCVRRRRPDRFAVGAATVELELAGGLPSAVSLHLAAMPAAEDALDRLDRIAG